MNVKRFKKILAVYMVVLILICIFIPCNIYFNGHRVNAGYLENEKAFFDKGIRYVFVGFLTQSEKGSLRSNNQYFTGTSEYEPNTPLIISEFAVLTVLFIGLSYITCKKE